MSKRDEEPATGGDVRWLAMLLMRCMLQFVHEVRRRYGLPPLEERR